MTQRDLHALANDNPEMLYAYHQAMNAVIEYRNEMTAIQMDHDSIEGKATFSNNTVDAVRQQSCV